VYRPPPSLLPHPLLREHFRLPLGRLCYFLLLVGLKTALVKNLFRRNREGVLILMASPKAQRAMVVAFTPFLPRNALFLYLDSKIGAFGP
jgi:hypothetical protein